VLLFLKSLRCQCGLSAYGISDFASVVALIFLREDNKSADKRTFDNLVILVESLVLSSFIGGTGE